MYIDINFSNRDNFIYKALLLIIFFIVFFNSKVNGQYSGTGVDGFSIDLKLGAYNNWQEDAGFGGGVEINVLKNSFIYSADYYRFDEFTIWGSSPQYFNQIGFMIGRYRRYNNKRIFRFIYQAGIASFWGLRNELIKEDYGTGKYSYYQGDHFFTVGLTTKLGIRVIPLTFFSIGVDLQTNINFKYPVLLPMITIEIGKLR